MTAQPYTTKKGVKQFRPVATAEEVFDGSSGFCLACGAEASGVEPDARQYRCEACGQPKVYGLEELVLMNLLIASEA